MPERKSLQRCFCSIVCALGLCSATLAAGPPAVTQSGDGVIRAGNSAFTSWGEYVRSDLFRIEGRRCGLPAAAERASGGVAGGTPSDCTYTFTNPDPV